MGKVFTHFSKPTRRFIEECIYGIQASGDAKLSSIVRAIDNDIRPVYTEKRLSRNLNNDALAAPIEQAILKDGVRSITSDTLLLVDPTEIRKEFSYKMQYVTRVRDASRSSKENCEIHFLKYTLPFIYRGEMHFRVQKMGKLQNRKCRCALKSGNAIMSV